MFDRKHSRREFCVAALMGTGALAHAATPKDAPFALRYILGSSMYGGAIPAILINTPGTAVNALTTAGSAGSRFSNDSRSQRGSASAS